MSYSSPYCYLLIPALDEWLFAPYFLFLCFLFKMKWKFYYGVRTNKMQAWNFYDLKWFDCSETTFYNDDILNSLELDATRRRIFAKLSNFSLILILSCTYFYGQNAKITDFNINWGYWYKMDLSMLFWLCFWF